MTVEPMRIAAAAVITLALVSLVFVLRQQIAEVLPPAPGVRLRRWIREELPGVARRAHAAIGAPDFRDLVILLGLGMVWGGLRDIYPPAAPLTVGAFLVWFTAIRRVTP